jgi:MFS family permease
LDGGCVGGLADVAKQEAGLASGLLNTSQQLGGAIGIAIASTVAATHLKTLLGEGQTPSAALTGGFHWALWVCGTVALLARPATAILARRTTPPALAAGISLNDSAPAAMDSGHNAGHK